jgi:hypothetical protein
LSDIKHTDGGEPNGGVDDEFLTHIIYIANFFKKKERENCEVEG